MKKQADLQRRELKFKVMDEVHLKLRPYLHHSLAKKQSEKLSPKFYGPYQVLEENEEVAYRLEHPLEAAIHYVSHISQVKLKLGQAQQVQHISSALTKEFELQVWSETILRVRWNGGS
ncbi:Transposon Tf2-11 polyprotein [Cucumis melo var. makuwa]|uniref:Transposon Tf2-11 polyprotein n=1 Tax=Cucumis melo var. makuwa TaxID=1194695 RepID=A0A5D3CSJ6_CUCMM|nr:Transposon Tf2-11 polyprotein [Cucumis melo var. makuwa]